MKTYDNIIARLGGKASSYLQHLSEKITKDELQVPDENFISKVFVKSNRKLQLLFKPFNEGLKLTHAVLGVQIEKRIKVA